MHLRCAAAASIHWSLPGIRPLVVCATVLDAMQHGFVPMVVRDACADRHPAPHEANLFDMQAKYAEVISESEALALFAR